MASESVEGPSIYEEKLRRGLGEGLGEGSERAREGGPGEGSGRKVRERGPGGGVRKREEDALRKHVLERVAERPSIGSGMGRACFALRANTAWPIGCTSNRSLYINCVFVT